MVKCAVRGCQNQSDLRPGEMISRPRKRFFSFPADKGRLRVWLAALRESECFSAELHQICEDHFLPEHITSTGISPDAIPIMPPLEGALLAAEDWTSPLEPGAEISEPAEVVTEIPVDDDDVGEEEDEDDYDDEEEEEEEEEDEEEEEYEDSDLTEEDPSNMDEQAESEWLSRLQENLKSSAGKKCIKPGSTPRSELTLGRLTKRFMDLFSSAPEGILDLNEATQKLGTRKRRVYDITSVLNGIKLITKRSKNKVQWVGPTPINSFKGHRKNKLKVDLINLTTMEEALDWLIKDCAQQLFALTDLKENANSAYVTYEDICRIAVFQDQTLITVKAPEETKLEVPTPTEECIKIHLKASRGPIHVLTSETDGPGSTTESKKPKTGCFRMLEESRIETKHLPTSVKRIPAKT